MRPRRGARNQSHVTLGTLQIYPTRKSRALSLISTILLIDFVAMRRAAQKFIQVIAVDMSRLRSAVIIDIKYIDN